MTSVFSCVVATIALAADPGLQGLPLGIPPAPDDAVISHVAPPQCLFYLNWAGTASPSASSSSETEKLLAEPEVQDFLNALDKVIVAYLRKTDEEANATQATAELTPSTAYEPCVGSPAMPAALPPAAVSPATGACNQPSCPSPSATPIQPPPANWSPYAGPATTAPLPLPTANTAPLAPPQAVPSQPSPADSPTLGPPTIPRPAGDPLRDLAIRLFTEGKPKVTTLDCGDMLNILVTHPTAIFITDVKAIPQKPTTKANTAEPKPSAFVAAVQASQSTGLSELTGMEIQAGMIVSLGPDAARLRAKLFNYLSLAKKAGVGDGVRKSRSPARPGIAAKRPCRATRIA